jgi:hypothetical protein
LESPVSTWFVSHFVSQGPLGLVAHQNGLPHVVGVMGADCSERQAELVVSLVKAHDTDNSLDATRMLWMIPYMRIRSHTALVLISMLFLPCLATYPQSTTNAPVQYRSKHWRPITPEEAAPFKAQGQDTTGWMVDDPSYLNTNQTHQVLPPTPADLKNAMVWLDNFMGSTNVTIPADVISMKRDTIRFRFCNQDWDYSGNFTVVLNTPRQHAKPYFGLGKPERAKLVMLEGVGGDVFPLQDATVWEKGIGFIDIEAIGKEWIHSGPYTVQN